MRPLSYLTLRKSEPGRKGRRNASSKSLPVRARFGVRRHSVLQLVNSFAVQTRSTIVFSEQKVSGSEVRIQFNGISILIDCVGVVTRHVVAESQPRADHEVKGVEL